jgi:lysophospholipase L1-like esterase
MPRRTRVVAGLGFSLLATVAMTAAVTPAQAATPGGSTYVALGDSYSSGVGAPPYSEASTTCLQSPKAYAPLYAAAGPVRSFTFAACSGARTANVLASQLTDLGLGTRLVTITIGGNDSGFSSVINACVGSTEANCVAAVAASKQFSQTELADRLDSTYRQIRTRAPLARLVVLGYPRLIELTPDCAAVPPLTLAKRTAMTEAIDTAGAVIADRAARTRALFVDVQPAFAGHGLCGADPWITGLTEVGPFHPNATGYQAGYLAPLRAAIASAPPLLGLPIEHPDGLV